MIYVMFCVIFLCEELIDTRLRTSPPWSVPARDGQVIGYDSPKLLGLKRSFAIHMSAFVS